MVSASRETPFIQYCCRLPIEALVRVVALDVPTLTALMVRGERARCKRVVCRLARSGADGALELLRHGRKALSLFKRDVGLASDRH